MRDTGGILLKILCLGCLCDMLTCDICSRNPCQNKGSCSTRGGDNYECSCIIGWYGKNCEINFDDCQSQPCKNGGTCIDKLNSRYECNCTDEYVGMNCQHKNPCFQMNKCKNGAKCMAYGNGNFICKCSKYFDGIFCEKRMSSCPVEIDKSRGMCNMNGNCDYDAEGAMICRCDAGYSGELCRTKIDNKIDIGCNGVLCMNGGRCVMQDNGSPFCRCPDGYTGDTCSNPVSIQNVNPRHIKNHDHSKDTTTNAVLPASTKALVVCSTECQKQRGDGICQQQCNTDVCQSDGGDCDPWKKCMNRPVSHCRKEFRNGKCNPECNNVDCLFDGQDCDKAPCLHSEKCSLVYQNGICNEDCNNPQCGFDGGDCRGKKTDSFFENFDAVQKCSVNTKSFELDLILLTTLENFQINKSKFLQTLGSTLKMVLTVSKVTEINFNDTTALSIQLNINPSECVIYGGQCFSSLEQISDFIKAGLSGHGAMSLPFTVANVDSRTVYSVLPKKTPLNSYFVILIAMTSLLIISLAIIGVLLRDRWGKLRTKIKTAGVWTPSEGYSTSTSSINSNNKTVWPVHLQPNNMKLESRNCDNGSYRYDPLKQSRLEVEFDGIPDVINRKRRYDIIDLNDKALTFQTISDNLQKRDGVNPMGPTQAKLLSIINENISVKPEQRYGDVEVAANDIGAYVNDVGESLMHIAGRMNSGPTLIKKLHNASPAMLNTTDEWGRTPLASAAASDSYESVEQLLALEKQSRKESKQNKIRSGQNSYTSCRTTDSPVKTTTALIESVKLNSKEMINLLLDEGSPVNVLDSGGRSVVHWAAMFNNVDLLERLSHMKIFQKLVDLKDNEEKSPLYLAASEGAFDSAKFIVEYIVKLDIKIDQIFPCPKSVAEEKGFMNIAQLISQAQLPSVYSEKAYKRMKNKDPKINKKLYSPIRELGIINEYKEYSADSVKMDKNSPSGFDSIDSCLLDMYSLEDSSLNNILDSYSNEKNNYSSFKPCENNYHSYLSNTSSSDMSPPLLNLNNPACLNGYNCHPDHLDPALQNAFFLAPNHTTKTHHDHIGSAANASTNNNNNNNNSNQQQQQQHHHHHKTMDASSDLYRSPDQQGPGADKYQYRSFNVNNLSSIHCPL